MEANHKPPHGKDIFNAHRNCDCQKCRPRREAVHRLVDSFSTVPYRWIEQLAKAEDEYLPLPMWGTLFVPKNSADVSNITKLLREIEPDDEEQECFASAGWKRVADTGIYAIEFDGEMLLGIHGAGYDFYSHHWARLYDRLGYRWH